MIPELGQFALIIALALALIQSLCPPIGLWYKQQIYMDIARPVALGQFVFLLFGYCCLTYAFISNDFSVSYVAQNSNTHLPLFFRVAAVWGAHEGSLLLWVTILGCWTALVAWFSKNYSVEIRVWVLSILGLLSSGFLLFLITTSNPFARYLPDSPLEGVDLNPLLQDVGLAIHPPMLYMGYVGFAVAFAFGMAALLTQHSSLGRDDRWVKWMRPWVIAAWCFLTFGITLGSWWAYRVLGWGGWWFWDPVENASLLPWLTGTALIHSLAVTEKKGLLKGWSILLAIVAFSLSLLGTFLVRSGILISVHAFASDPARGKFLLEFLAIVIGTALLLYAIRAPKFSSKSTFAFLSRETFLLANNAFLLIIMATTLLGTLYPLIIDALGLGKISVGPPYFNAVFLPLAVPLLLAMGMGPLCYWEKISSSALLRRLYFPLGFSLAVGIFLLIIFAWKVPIVVIIAIVLASWVIVATVLALVQKAKEQGIKSLTHKQWGMALAHLGVAVCAIGITFASYYKIERDVKISIGETVQVGNYLFTFKNLTDIQGPNYTGVTALFSVKKNDELITFLQADKRIYTAPQIAMAVPAIAGGLFHDLYIALGEPLDSDNSWSVRIFYKPLVRWIWLGGLMMLVGGMLSIGSKKKVIFNST